MGYKPVFFRTFLPIITNLGKNPVSGPRELITGYFMG